MIFAVAGLRDAQAREATERHHASARSAAPGALWGGHPARRAPDGAEANQGDAPVPGVHPGGVAERAVRGVRDADADVVVVEGIAGGRVFLNDQGSGAYDIPFEDFDTNAVGTLNLLELCRQTKIPKFIRTAFASRPSMCRPTT